MLERTNIIIDFLVCAAIIVAIFLCGYIFRGLVQDIETVNAIEDSTAFAGYSPVGVHTIFDRTNGVMYAVSDTGDIELMVNEDGTPKMIPE